MEHTLLRRIGVLLSVGALLALALVSCDGSTSFASAARTPLAPESATPAMTATPTSAATSSPTTVELATPDLTPASSAGWATYRDRRFGFAVPFPPGWQPASLIWPQDPVPSDYSGYVYYMVQFFPPGPHGEPGFGAVEKGPEVIQIIITLSGPSASFPHGTNPYPYPNFGMVALGSQQTSLYGLWLPSSELELGVVTTMANLPMNLGMHYMAIRQWDPAIAQRDVSVFLAMLKGYRPM
jgi:hypothetical protein